MLYMWSVAYADSIFKEVEHLEEAACSWLVKEVVYIGDDCVIVIIAAVY